MKRRLGPNERLYPMPCTLVVGGSMDDAGVLAVAWINIVSSTPPTVALGIRESRNTLELIRSSNSFTVNIPPASLAKQVDYCGLVSGRGTDKFADTGMTLEPSAVVEAPIIAECPVNLECRLSEEVVVGSYRVLLGEVVETHADAELMADPDSDLIDVGRLDPLVYIPGSREYRRLGEKVADAFEIGKADRTAAE